MGKSYFIPNFLTANNLQIRCSLFINGKVIEIISYNNKIQPND